MTTGEVLHLVPAEAFEALPPGEPYLPGGFSEDGFIHCTRGADVLRLVANLFYREAPGDFLVLVVDPSKLSAPLRDEAPDPPLPPDSPLAGVVFPHIYGPLDRAAIVAIRRAQRAPDGAFLAL